MVVWAPRPEAVTAGEAGRPKTGYGAWTPVAPDAEPRLRTPRIGLWLDSSDRTPAETVDVILTGGERARGA